jgi:hypothetical protein
MEYPLKWGIFYKKRPYIELYGKKRAYDLLYQLSMCVDGLMVLPVHPKSRWKKDTNRIHFSISSNHIQCP